MCFSFRLISCIVIFILNSTDVLGGISTGAIFLICEAFPVVFLCCLVISTFCLGLRWFQRSFRVNVYPELSDLIQQKEYVGVTPPCVPEKKLSAAFLRKRFGRKKTFPLAVSDTLQKPSEDTVSKRRSPIFDDRGDWAGDGACYTADDTGETGITNNKSPTPRTNHEGARGRRKWAARRSLISLHNSKAVSICLFPVSSCLLHLYRHEYAG